MPRENRVPIMMSDAELALIDDWAWRNRVSTRSKAIRLLCMEAMKASVDAKPRVRVPAISVAASLASDAR